jgi:hypothetical protein
MYRKMKNMNFKTAAGFTIVLLSINAFVGCNNGRLGSEPVGPAGGSVRAEPTGTPPPRPTSEKTELPESPTKSVDTELSERELKYEFYGNSRFGYSVEYPSELLVPQGEAPNGDGQIFSNDESEMRVFGTNLLLNETLEAEFKSLLKEKKGVKYKVLKTDFFVLSGEDKGRIYYQKTMRGGNEDFLTFMIEYPADKRDVYDRAVTKIVKTFKK